MHQDKFNILIAEDNTCLDIFFELLDSTDPSEEPKLLRYSSKWARLEGYDKKKNSVLDYSACFSKLTEDITEKVLSDIRLYKIDIEELDKAFLIVNMNGAFIEDDKVIQGDKPKTLYNTANIISSKPNLTIKRNHAKQQLINALLNTPHSIEIKQGNRVKQLPLSLFYISCNLSHLLVDNPNASPQECEDEFIIRKATLSSDLISKELNMTIESLLPCSKDYKKTWEFIAEKNTNNSLKRYANCALLLNYLKRN